MPLERVVGAPDRRRRLAGRARRHRGPGPAEAAGLSLVAGRSFDNLVSVDSSQAPGTLRVAPFMPDASLLIDKLANDPPAVGDRMPLGQSPLTTEQIDLFRAWIDRGAPDD